jgi:predicted ArsR family transcriptional regulator
MRTNVSRASRHQSFAPPAREWAPQFNLAEAEFRTVVEELEDRLVHHCERPEIEVRILDFIARAHGPSTEGIAAEMGISPAAAKVHLRQLRKADRIWGQPIRGGGMGWYASQAGRHFLGEKVVK